jgi:hypothetical protein
MFPQDGCSFTERIHVSRVASLRGAAVRFDKPSFAWPVWSAPGLAGTRLFLYPSLR